MKVVGHRALTGANLYFDGPVDRLVVRFTTWDAKRVADAFEGTTVQADWSDAGDVIGACALHFQEEAGVFDARFRRHFKDEDGDLVVLTAAPEGIVASAAARAAVRAVRRALADEDVDLEGLVGTVRAAAADGPPAATRRILDLARERGIPVMPLAGDDHYQLGWGHLAKRLWHGLPGDLSALGVEIARDHERAKEVLNEAGLRTPRFRSRRTLSGAEDAADELGYPVTVKPLRGRGGVTPLVRSRRDLEAAYDRAKEKHRWVVVEDHVRGTPHELLVIAGTVVSALREEGGRMVDVTDTLHPAVKRDAERAVRLCQTDTAAVQIVAADLETPLKESRGAIVGLDPEPDHARHPGRGAASALLDGLFPTGNGRVPLVAVTGTNGKTTTVRLIAHVLKFAGGRVGMACTGAVEVENHVVLKGDYSGPRAAATVLREPGVTHAVLEVARGGLLRRGLGFDAADVAVFTNVASDHLGQGGIDTLEDLARLKGVVVRAVSPTGTAVLNADDPLVWAQRSTVRGRVIPFTLDPQHPDLAPHLAADATNVAVTVRDGNIVILRGRAEFEVVNVLDAPITLGGAAMFNVQNACATVAAGYALGVKHATMRAALTAFNATTGQLPGRMNLLDLGGVKVLLDYGHNVPALKALATVLPRLSKGRKINVANASGNRRTEDLLAFGTQLASMYDRIIVADPDPRGRERGVTSDLIKRGILDAGFPPERLSVELEELAAARRALAESRPGDLVVLQVDATDAIIDLCTTLRARLEAGESPADLNEELLAQ